MPTDERDVSVEIQTSSPDVRGANRIYARDVQIGRDDTCDVWTDAGVVSRRHARLVYEDGRWWVVDDDSTNGTYLDGEEVDREPLPAEAELQLGTDGPTFQLRCSGGQPPPEIPSSTDPTHSEASAEITRSEVASTRTEQPGASGGRGGGRAQPEGSVTQYVQRYFEGDDEPEGEHTRRLRQAYERVQQKERRRYLWLLGGALALCLVVGGYAFWQYQQNQRYREIARSVFASMKQQDIAITKLKRRIKESENVSLQKQLASLERQQEQQRQRYDGFVKELGVYRELTPREEAIYKVARIFGESEFGVPAGFVRKVKNKIETYWKTPQGRSRLKSAFQRAREKGYTEFIARTMRAHSLPPEFFYLALQESGFDVKAVGPPTDWGIAKGMWQFIPKTARRYGLRLGPRKGRPVVDFQDERHDFGKSTRAAARYLQEIYSTEAQASGLLIIASYNWGEHRINDKLEHLPKGIPEKALRGIPENPDKRNYWRFLKRYDERMPAQTKDYVLKVFSAAVIGRNPDLFGFEMTSPLQKYLERGSVTAAGSAAEGMSSGVQAPRPTSSSTQRGPAAAN
jgi:membrane-bound lytic murein transglycosylase D